MTEAHVDVIWGDTYLDVYTYFVVGKKKWRLLSYYQLDGEAPIINGDPEVWNGSAYSSYEHISEDEIPDSLVDFINELNQKAHDRIALEKMKGRPR